MAHLLDELNPQQRAAVEQTEGPLLILAGAGSGKTRVITYRIAYLILACCVPPESILAVTFTNKAADQMKERVARLLGEHADPHEPQPHISTFHSFCVRVLRHDIPHLGYTRDFSIYDEDDQQRVIKACISELGLEQQVESPRAVLSRISYAKNQGLTPEELYKRACDPVAERLASLFDRYETRLRQANALDFDDLLSKTVQLFYTSPEVCGWYNRRFRYILVDEYQDTNRTQYELIRQLTLEHQNLCVVGDEDQSIYRWRGADIANILNFQKDYPRAKIIRLEQNYRSTQTILDAAAAVVSRNRARIGKSLWTEQGQGQKIVLLEARDAEEESQFVASQIAKQIAANGATSVAVLYRTNAQSRLLEEALRRERIPYRLVGASSFYARTEVKDTLAYARLACNLQDSAALERIINTPPRGIGDTTLEFLRQFARQHGLSLWEAIEHEVTARSLPPRALKALEAFHNLIHVLVGERSSLAMGEFFKSVLERTGYIESLKKLGEAESQDRIENLQELVTAAAEAAEQGVSLSEFLDHAALVSDADEYDERAPVTLMTLHSAKGLEFDAVFLVGMEEGLFPHKLSLNDEAALEEERRLCYVGMTRARQWLGLSWARQRRSFAREASEGSRPSRFLDEVPSELLELLNSGLYPWKERRTWENALNDVTSVESALKARRIAAGGFGPPGKNPGASTTAGAHWKLGAKVRHPKYGIGTVLDLEMDGENTKLTISFPGYGRKKMMDGLAPLERL